MARIPISFAYSQRPQRPARTPVRPAQAVVAPEPTVEAQAVEEAQVVEETTVVEEAPVVEEATVVKEATVDEETDVAEEVVEEASTSTLPEWNPLMKKADLYEIAEKAGLSVNPEMTKAEIVDLLKTVQ